MMVALKGKDPKKAKPQKPKILVYGKAGVGKTWGALEWPNVYYIDSEGGANLEHYTDKLVASGGAYLGPEDGANDLDMIVEQVRALATQKHDYKTLVIDSFTKAFATRIQEQFDVLSKKMKDMTSTYGAEKKPAIAKTKQLIAWLDKLDMNVLIICHEGADWKNKDAEGNPTVTFDGYDKLEYELHLVMRIVKQGTARKAVIGKCRLNQFREGEIIDWNYEAFAKRYGLELIESKTKPVAPASAEQIRVIEELARVVRLDETLQTKWFDKAGVDSWGEMDSDTIQACIDYLKSQLPTTASA